MQGLYLILAGGAGLSILHALIPNHWAPLVVVARGNNWSSRQLVSATLLAGGAHMASTVFIGIIIATLGLTLSERSSPWLHYGGPGVLIALGAFFIFRRGRHHIHDDQHGVRGSTQWAIIGALALSMFLSPCVELEVYYLYAVREGWLGILGISLEFMVITVGLMVALVMSGNWLIDRLNLHALEHHEGKVTGGLLILLGLAGLVLD